jgi:pyruvate/2-oxoglutarate dehydrogenase complex dihydrolipoamide dehydrogenase (E3) component
VQGRCGDAVRLHLQTQDGARAVDGSDLLVATGRTPMTRAIGLKAAGVELDVAGRIRVKDRQEITGPDTWDLGECAGSPQQTHVCAPPCWPTRL